MIPGTVVDAHCHAGEGDGFTGPWDTAAPLARYLLRAEQAGIAHAVLFSAFHSDYAHANRIVARLVARAPTRFAGFAFVNARTPAERIARDLRTAIVDHGFCGIKVHAHDGRISRAVCELARQYRVPILYDVMGDVGSIELVAGEYPTVPFIIPHLASFADDWRAQRAFIDVLTRLPNVYTDTSGVRRFDLLVEAVERAGPAKVLFGSDGPWLHPGVELAKIRALHLPAHAERLIVGGNLLRLIRPPSAWRARATPTHAHPGVGSPTSSLPRTTSAACRRPSSFCCSACKVGRRCLNSWADASGARDRF